MSLDSDWGRVIPLPLRPLQVTFAASELRVLMDVYARKVAAGEWRDYALDFLKDRAVFSIFRRSAEIPLYRVEKIPHLARKQGMYSLSGGTGQIFKRGPDLGRVLRFLEKPNLVNF